MVTHHDMLVEPDGHGELVVSCSCGRWDKLVDGYMQAEDAFENHCDAVFMEATEAAVRAGWDA